jgi:hypothetical protein
LIVAGLLFVVLNQLQFATAGFMLETIDSFLLDLTNTFPRQVEFFPNFIEG